METSVRAIKVGSPTMHLYACGLGQDEGGMDGEDTALSVAGNVVVVDVVVMETFVLVAPQMCHFPWG